MRRNYTPKGRLFLPLLFLLSSLTEASASKILENISVSIPNAVLVVCPGDTIEVTGVLVNSDCANYQIEWSSEEDSLLTHIFPANSIAPKVVGQRTAVQYKLKVTEDCTGNSDSLTITVMPSVFAEAGVDKSLCEDKTTAIGITASPGITYSWTPAAGLSAANISNPAVSYAAQQTIVYRLTASDSTGCAVTDSMQIRFFELPKPSFAADTVCEGTVTTFTNLTVNTPTIASWLWNFGDGGATSTVKNPTRTFPSGNGYNVTLTATTTDGCVSSFTKKAEVATMPSISGVIKADPNDCNSKDGRIVVTANTTYSVYPGLEYSIDGGASWFFSRTFNGLNGGSYPIVVRNGGVCVKTGATIALQEPPSPFITGVDKTDPSDCNAKNGTIRIIAGGGTGSLLYSIDGLTWSSNPNFTGLGAGSYPTMVRNSNGTCRINNGLTILAEPAAPVITFVQTMHPSNCGSIDGSLKINTSGGIGSLEYSIDGGTNWATSNLFENLPQGAYGVRVRNANGTCTVTGGNAELRDPLAPKINNLLSQNPTDCGATNGAIEIDATPGATLLNYSIDGGATWETQPIFQNLAQANYPVRIRNSDGTCVVNAGSVALAEPKSPVIETVAFSNPTDCGVNDGTLEITATEGIGAFRYSIDNGATWFGISTFAGLSGGNYEVKIANADGTCPVSAGTTTLIAPVAPANATFSAADPTVCNGTNGVIVLSAESANGVQYSIDGGATWLPSGNFAHLGSGQYDLKVRNTDGTCITPVSTLELAAPAAVSIQNVEKADVSDCGLTDGAIIISTDYAGTAELEYSIDNGFTWTTQDSFQNLPGGDYQVKVRTNDGACEVSGDAVFIHTPIAPVVVGLMPINPKDCDQNDGRIFLLTNGLSNFEVSIDNGLTYQNKTIFDGLGAGVYSVKVRNTDGTCLQDLGQTTLTAPSKPIIVNVDKTNPSACQLTDGKIVINAQGAANLQCSIDGGYSWQNHGAFDQLSAGNYKIKVRNADQSCELEGPEVELRGNGSDLSIQINPLSPNCGAADGSIEIVAGSATAPVEYSIDGGQSWKQSGIFNNLTAGFYAIAVRETNLNCATNGGMFELTATGEPVFQNFSKTDPSHCLSSDGNIEVHATGMLGGIEYSVDGGRHWQSSPVFTGLKNGTYRLMVRYANSTCAVEGGEAILAAVGAPIIGGVERTHPTCRQRDGQINVHAMGVSGVEYSIDGGTTWSATPLFSNLSVGAYEVKVRNTTGGCTATAGFFQLQTPQAPQIDEIFRTDPDCTVNNGKIQISLIEELPGESQYSIDGGANWQIGSIFENLPEGEYTVTVRNMSSGDWCETDPKIVVLTKPATPTLAMSFANPTDCGLNDGRITANATGSKPMEYSLDGDLWRVDNVFTGLGGGTYNLHVRYQDGTCELVSNAVRLTAPSSPGIVELDVANPDCDGEGGFIRIVATAGSLPLEYSVDGGDTWQPDSIFSDLPAGNYFVIVRNNDGSCEVSAGDAISLEQPAKPTLTRINPAVPACGQSNGSLEIIAALGAEPLSLLEYSVDGGATWQASNRFENMAAGVYAIRLRRSDTPCEVAVGNFRLNAPEMPVIQATDALSPNNCNAKNGRIEILATGRYGLPDAGLQYSIDGGTTWATTPLFENLGAGNYRVEVRFDDGSCEVVGNLIQLTEPGEIQRTSLTTVRPDCDKNNGEIAVTASGDGHSPVQFSIDGGDNWSNNGTFPNLGAGNYQLAFRYADATCFKLDSLVELKALQSVVIQNVSVSNPSDCRRTDGSMTILANGTGVLEYSLNGNDWQSSNFFANLPAGNYQPRARLLDFDCTANWNTVTIAVPEALVIQNVTVENISDCGIEDGSIAVQLANGATGQFSIDGGDHWSFSNVFTDLPKGEFYIYVRKLDGSCVTVYGNNPVRIRAPQAPDISTDEVHPACHQRDGSITVTAISISNPDNLPFEYALDNGPWQSSGTFTRLRGGAYLAKARLTGTSCIAQTQVVLSEPANCPPCETLFAIDRLEFEELTISNPICVPMPLVKTLEYDLFLDGRTVTQQGGCDAVNTFFYGYGQLVSLGATDGPFQLEYWRFNGTDYTGTFQTFDQLVTMMNGWDPDGNWRHDAGTYSISGGKSGSAYGNLRVKHQRTNRAVTLMNNTAPDYRGIQLTVTGAEVHTLIAVSKTDACSDTIFIQIHPRPLPKAYHIYKHLKLNEVSQICDWQTYLPYSPDLLLNCGNPQYGNLRLQSGNCARYTPQTDFAGYDKYCLMMCKTINNITVCDTAYVHFAIAPPTDTMRLFLEPGEALDTCLNEQVQLAANAVTARDCGGSGISFSATPGNEVCMNFLANNTFRGATQICIVHCIPVPVQLGGQLCDTTILNIEVAKICDDSIFDTDTLTVEGINGRTEICLPIPAAEIGDYKLRLDGNVYAGTLADCAEDSVYTYNYVAVPGMGNAGPYRVRWMLNGSEVAANVPNMAALVDSMKVWNPAGNWQLRPATFTIVGVKTVDTYGLLTVTHPGLNITVPIMPNLSTQVNGTLMQVTGAGTHLLIAENTVEKCIDVLYITVENRIVRTKKDTLYLVTEEDVVINNECLSANELPGNVVFISICGQPAHGALTFNGNRCFNYLPEGGYIGSDEACVVICDNYGVCDTTILKIEILEKVLCSDLIGADSLAAELTICKAAGEVCLPLAPMVYFNYDLFDNGRLFSGTVKGCNVSTVYLYNLGNLPAMGNQGPYRLEKWEVGTATFSGIFVNLKSLVDSMNVWDAGGNWGLNSMDNTVMGGKAQNVYGSMEFVQVSTNIRSTITVTPGLMPMGTEIALAPGSHELIFVHKTDGCRDTVQYQINCPPLTDLKIDTTVRVDESVKICLRDLNLNFDLNYVSTINNICNPQQHVRFVFDMAENCIVLTGQTIGRDTACYRICLQNGQCMTLTVAVRAFEPCKDFIAAHQVAANLDCRQQQHLICVTGFSFAVPDNYSLTLDGQPYTGNLTACDMDSLYSISYAALPGQGGAGPYRLVSWRVNSDIFSGEFQDIPALVDSMNRWDPKGNWRHEPAGLSISGGFPANRYGVMSMVQISTNAPAMLNVNSLFIPHGIGFLVDAPGIYEAVFTEKISGCLDSVAVYAACVESEMVRDTIKVGADGKYCVNTSELPGSRFSVQNVCAEDSGERVVFNWSNQDTCVFYYGFEAGAERACLVVCDELGFCDTTYLLVTVLDEENIDTSKIVANPDTLKTRKNRIGVLNVLINDDLAGKGADDFYLLTYPQHGTAMLFVDGTLQYTPFEDYCDNERTDDLEYVVCNSAGCDTSMITVKVDCEPLKVYNGFSPNGDDENDTLIIEGVELYPNNRLQIFNRWGTLVLEKEKYRNDWDGKWEGLDVPDGTYFYLFDDGNGNTFSGYIQIQR